MGLLDMNDQGLLGLHMLAAASAKPRRTGFGEGLLGAIQGVQQQRSAEEDRKARKQMQEMQMQQQQMQMQAMQEQQRRAQALEQFRQGIPSPQMAAVQTALQGGGGPTQANAQAMPPVNPLMQQLHGAMKAGAMDPLQYLQMQAPKAPDYKVVGDSLVGIGPDGVKEAYRAPQKQSLNDMIVMGPDGKPVLNELLFEAKQKLARAGASKVEVPINLGQKGFDNTLKLRGDFRSEPVYKAHQEMTSAYSQIKQSLKQESPAGDLAGATKIMKLLDPGSVVRESELGMAMAATGLLDRVGNYASMIMSGNKLTPSQRKDFQSLADKLYAESNKQYNSKRGEYQGIAERNGLNAADVLGGEAGNVIDFGSLQ
jgi:hypothetical protein